MASHVLPKTVLKIYVEKILIIQEFRTCDSIITVLFEDHPLTDFSFLLLYPLPLFRKFE